MLLARRGTRLLAAVAVVGYCAAFSSLPAGAAPRLGDGSGLHVVSQTALDPRLIALTVSTPAMNGQAKLRILLPAGYSTNRRRRYPVLYLLHGTSGGAADWTTNGDAERTTAGLPVIVVMPDIGLGDDGGGWCTNWYNGGAYGLPEWETFHIDQLIPWVDRNLPTIANRAGRAIAGLSQGGFCSTSYAARHPDLFATALAYSGAPDIAYDAEAQALVTPVIQATATFLDGASPDAMFGDRAREEINWANHDPTTLANNLRGMNLLIYTGNGQAGPLDSGAPNLGASGLEAGVHRLSVLFHNRLESLGIPSLFDDYGAGTHSWPYWTRDLRQSIGPIMRAFAHPPARPRSVTYTTADARYSVFGWQVTMHRLAAEFSTLANAAPGGFTLAGSGSATVVTTAFHRPRKRYTVILRGESLYRTISVIADRNGRLRIEVPLGPANPDQQYTAAAEAAGTKVYTTTVRITPGWMH